MRDFPMFPTEHGVATLITREIPYRSQAYIHCLDVQPGELEPMLEECVSFCRACGAEKVYACGHEDLEKYPLYTTILEMRGPVRPDPEKVEQLFPVTEETLFEWRRVCNRSMRAVDNARTLETKDDSAILESGGAYFVHRAGKLLGIGWLDGQNLLCVAAVEPGMGERVMHTLMSAVNAETMILEVASTNHRAIRLYEKLGFLKTREINRWFQVK